MRMRRMRDEDEEEANRNRDQMLSAWWFKDITWLVESVNSSKGPGWTT